MSAFAFLFPGRYCTVNWLGCRKRLHRVNRLLFSLTRCHSEFGTPTLRHPRSKYPSVFGTGDQILWGIMEPPLAPPRLFCTPYSFRSSLCICACKRVSRSCYTVSVDRQVQTSYTQYDADSLRQRAAQHHLGGSCSVTESEPMSDGRA